MEFEAKTITEIKPLADEFIDFLPCAAAIRTMLVGTGSRIKPDTWRLISDMMDFENLFRVNVQPADRGGHVTINIVHLTHVATDFNFTGNITPKMAEVYRRKVLEVRERNNESEVNFEASEIRTTVSTLTSIGGGFSLKKISPLHFQLEFDDSDTVSLRVINNAVTIEAADVSKMVKHCDSEKQVKIRLIVRKAKTNGRLSPLYWDKVELFPILNLIEVIESADQVKSTKFSEALLEVLTRYNYLVTLGFVLLAPSRGKFSDCY